MLFNESNLVSFCVMKVLTIKDVRIITNTPNTEVRRRTF